MLAGSPRNIQRVVPKLWHPFDSRFQTGFVTPFFCHQFSKNDTYNSTPDDRRSMFICDLSTHLPLSLTPVPILPFLYDTNSHQLNITLFYPEQACFVFVILSLLNYNSVCMSLTFSQQHTLHHSDMYNYGCYYILAVCESKVVSRFEFTVTFASYDRSDHHAVHYT